MSFKVRQQEPSITELRQELEKAKSGRVGGDQDRRLKEIAKSFASIQQWDSVMETLQLVSNEEERNLLIADIIETFLLPAQEINQAKKFAKYLTQTPEIQPLVLIRIALAGNEVEQAKQIAERLPSPLSRNFALLQIVESYFLNEEREKAYEASDALINNTRTIYDPKSRSYILRDIAIDVFLAHREKERAKEIAMLIPDEKVRTQVLNKIGL